MGRQSRIWVAAAVALLAVVVPSTANADAVRDWNLNASNALANPVTAGGAGQTPPVASLHMAMVQGAVYDAVNSIDRGHQPYLANLPPASQGASIDAAVATAAHHVLVGIVPALPQNVRDSLDALYATALGAISPGQARTDGVSAGAAAAAAMLAARANDGRYVPFSFVAGTGPGQWRPELPVFVSDPFAWVARVKPFTLVSTAQFRTKGPNSLRSGKYTKEFEEVKTLGSATSTTRTAEQTATALFYSDHAVALWNRTFRDVAAQYQLAPVDEARLFGLINLAGADGLINCWDDKWFWSFWRPITAIRLADTDGNPKTIADPGWLPLAPTPPYPDQPSGYNCVSGAVLRAARAFFHTNSVMFSVHSNVTNSDKFYDHLLDPLVDTIDARVWLGIHFRTADVDGATLGKRVGRWVGQNFLRPVKGKHVDDDDVSDDD
ncbi:MAG TPA: vanadium-dependent haloperoxidase [Gaiellaceae bacterium]